MGRIGKILVDDVGWNLVIEISLQSYRVVKRFITQDLPDANTRCYAHKMLMYQVLYYFRIHNPFQKFSAGTGQAKGVDIFELHHTPPFIYSGNICQFPQLGHLSSRRRSVKNLFQG